MEANPQIKIENYIKQKKEMHSLLLEYIDNEENDDCGFDNFTKFVDNTNTLQDVEELKILLRLIVKISKYHYRMPNFFSKLERIILHYQKYIKQTLSNLEIYELFKNSKRILLFLFEKGILIKDMTIINKLLLKVDPNGVQYCHFFFPEIEELLKEKNPSQIEGIKNEMLSIDQYIFTDFEQNRKIGENNSYICKLIRNDSVEDFISYATRTNLNLRSELGTSIFETNTFLIKNNPTIIEYAEFYGSIEIFQYLLLNGVQMNPISWFYTIHGNNAEMVHILEDHHVSTIFHGSYSKCLEASIQFHNKAVADYVYDNLIKDKHLFIEEHSSYDENILNYCFHYYNFVCLPDRYCIPFTFYYLCQYNYYNLVVMFLEKNTVDLNHKIHSITFFFDLLYGLFILIFLIWFCLSFFFHAVFLFLNF